MALSGFAKLLLACPEEAISLLRRSIEINRNYPLAHFWLAAALMLIGQRDEARAATQAGLALSPKFTIARVYRNTRSPWIDNYYQAQRQRIYERLLFGPRILVQYSCPLPDRQYDPWPTFDGFGKKGSLAFSRLLPA
jgi:tetratricopeptide (TPR) repeat protein